MKPIDDIEIPRLRTLLDYDPASGALIWKTRPARCIHVGDVAGALKQDGYIVVSIGRKSYPAHRIAWALSNNEWPNGLIDHISGNRSDNRLVNLRVVDSFTNMQNQRKAHKSNLSSKTLGVHYYARTNRWRATIYINGKHKYLGYYATKEEAEQVYLRAKRDLHPGCTL